MNKAVFAGRVGQDAELRYTSSGTPVASFSLALDNGKDKEGDKRTPTWVKATLWEKRAESLAQYITKGKFVIVSGPVSVEAWIDSKSGEAKSKLTITVNEFEFGGGNGKEEDGNANNGRGNSNQRYQREAEQANAEGTGIQDEDIPF